MIVISIKLFINIVIFMVFGLGVLVKGWGFKDCIVKMY